MLGTLTAERVRRDVEVLALAGLDLGTFLSEVDQSLRRAVPNVAVCVATVDPATCLITGTHKFGDLVGRDDHDYEWGVHEYLDPEPTSFAELARRSVTAVGMHLETGGVLTRSHRMSELLIRHFGYADELRMLARSGDQVWGGVALFRSAGDRPFTAAEVGYAATLSAPLAAGLRSGVLARLAASPPPVTPQGPSVIIVNSDDVISQVSVGAEERLAEVVHGDASPGPTNVVAALVGQARQYAARHTGVLPHGRVRGRSGQWFVLHASPLSGVEADVVVTIEAARPPEIVSLLVAAFGLTTRERDVTQLVLQGVDTKEIAAALTVSAYTVQDHLKAVFDKAGVRSRRELIARIFFDQYVPRLNTDLGPTGWFARS